MTSTTPGNMLQSLWHAMRTQPLWALVGAVALAVVIAVVGVLSLCQSSYRARQAMTDLERCQGMARQIQKLSRQPTHAGEQELEQAELARRIEQAAAAQQIPTASLVRIWPEPARRLGESPYKEKNTQVLLRLVSLRQTIGLLQGLSSGNAAMNVRSLRLTAPREQEAAGDRWTAEVTLSYRIYAPQTPGAGVSKLAP